MSKYKTQYLYHARRSASQNIQKVNFCIKNVKTEIWLTE